MACSTRNDANLIAHAAGALDASEGEPIERHLAECEECRAALSAQQSLWKALDAYPAPSPSGDFDRRLYARIAEAERRPWWRRLAAGNFGLPGVRMAAPVAAACVALCAAFLFRVSPAPATATTPGRPVAVEYHLNVDQVERTLDDLDMLKQLTAAPAKDEAQTSASQT